MADALLEELRAFEQPKPKERRRPVIQLPDGNSTTERSITVTDPSINNGRPTNIPTIYGGKILGDPNDFGLNNPENRQAVQQQAINIISQSGGEDPDTGTILPSFETIEEAVKAAQIRSDEGGARPDLFSPQPPLIRDLQQLEQQTTAPPQTTEEKVSALFSLPVMAVQGMGKGMLDIAGMPADLTNLFLQGLESAGLPTRGRVPGGSKQLQELFTQTLPDLMGISRPYEPRTAAERVAERAGREVGGAITGIGLAAKGGQALKAAPSLAGRMTTQDLLRGSLKEPMKNILRELASLDQTKLLALETILATSTGTAAGITKEFTDNPLAEIGSQLTVGFGAPAALGLVRGVIRAPQTIVRKMTGGAPDEKVAAYIVRSLRRGGTKAEQNLEEALKLQTETPEFKPTLGQAADVPELTMTERAQLRRSEGAVTQFRGQKEDNLNLIADRLEQLRGASDTDAGLDDVIQTLETRLTQESGLLKKRTESLVGRLRERRRIAQAELETTRQTKLAQAKRITAGLDRRLATAEAKANAARERLDILGSQESGRILRDEVKQVQDDFYRQASQLYDAIDPAGRATGPTPKLWAEIDRIEQEMLERIRPEDFPSREVAGIKAAIQKATPAADPEKFDFSTAPVSFETLKNFRSALLRRQRERGATSATRDLIETTDNAMRSLVSQVDDPGILVNFDKARNFYRTNIRKFTTGAGEEILRRTSRGREGFQVPYSQVADRFFSTRGDATERAQEFTQLVGGRERAVDALTEWAANDFLSSGVVNPLTGAISARRYRQWIQKHEDALQAFPELKNQFATIANAQQRIEEVMASSSRILRHMEGATPEVVKKAEGAMRATDAQVRTRTRQVVAAKNRLEKQLLADTFGPDVERNVERALRATNPRELNRNVTRLVQAVGDDDVALRGLRRAFIDELIRRSGRGATTSSGQPILDPRRLLQFTRTLEPSFRMLYMPEHLDEVKQLARMLEIVRRTERSPVGFGSDTAENLYVGKRLQELIQIGRPTALVKPSRRIKLRLLGKGLRTIGTWMSGLHDSQVDALLNEALFNPDIGHTLELIRQPGTRPNVIQGRIHAHLLQLGLEAKQASFGEPEPHTKPGTVSPQTTQSPALQPPIQQPQQRPPIAP